jgi:flavin-dependent dehydrogenase
MQKVLIIGNGIAGLSCARLLANRGWEIEIWGKHEFFSPTLILNQITCNLLQDIWQLNPSFWNSWHFLQERRVCWGKDASVLSMAEPSAVINGNSLRDGLWKHLLDKHHNQVQFQEVTVSIDNLLERQSEFTWIIDAGGRQSAIAQKLGAGHRHSFGNRCILSQEVRLANLVEEDIYWIETVSEGWLFLAPLGDNRAILQSMVPLLSGESGAIFINLLKQTRYIQDCISQFSGTLAIFAASPQILQPFCGERWLAVGDASFSVDPFSGDGTGYAIRGAILAASIIDAVASGLSSSDCLEHYSLRLQKAFDAHIQQCFQYYLKGFTSSLWQWEIERMRKAQELLQQTKNKDFTYTLKGFQFVKRETVD